MIIQMGNVLGSCLHVKMGEAVLGVGALPWQTSRSHFRSDAVRDMSFSSLLKSCRLCWTAPRQHARSAAAGCFHQA